MYLTRLHEHAAHLRMAVKLQPINIASFGCVKHLNLLVPALCSRRLAYQICFGLADLAFAHLILFEAEFAQAALVVRGPMICKPWSDEQEQHTLECPHQILAIKERAGHHLVDVQCQEGNGAGFNASPEFNGLQDRSAS